MISLIAFLGNYGKEYQGNRHNVPWIYANSFPFLEDASWQEKFKGLYTSFDNEVLASKLGVTKKDSKSASRFYFLKPLTFMNLSGESIAPLANFYKIKPEEILVVHDELELPLGTVSLKWAGGLGGHNGLRSAKACLGTEAFWRLRIGIGRPDHSDIASYVLSDFSKDQRIVLDQEFMQMKEFFASILFDSPEKQMKEWSKKKLVEV